MKKVLHLALAAVAVLLLATACNKPTPETTEYVTDSHGRRLVSKIEIKSMLSDGIEYGETTFEYDKDLRIAVVRRKERYDDEEAWSTEECRYEYFSDRIVARYIIKKDYDSIVNMMGLKGYIDSCLYYKGENISQKETCSYDLNGRLTSIDYETYEWNGDLLSVVHRRGEEHLKYISDKINRANIGFVDFGDIYDCIDPKSMVRNYFSNFSKGFVSERTFIWDDSESESEPYTYTIDYSFDDDGFVNSFVVSGWEDLTDEDHVKVSYLKK